MVSKNSMIKLHIEYEKHDIQSFSGKTFLHSDGVLSYAWPLENSKFLVNTDPCYICKLLKPGSILAKTAFPGLVTFKSITDAKKEIFSEKIELYSDKKHSWLMKNSNQTLVFDGYFTKNEDFLAFKTNEDSSRKLEAWRTIYKTVKIDNVVAENLAL